MQILYGFKGAGSVAPQALLTHLKVPFELKLISSEDDDHLSESFRAINPRGQIPVLVLDNGSIVTESLAIMLHIADCHPQSGMLPPPGSVERAQAYRWTAYCATNLYEGYLRLFYPDMFTTAPELSHVEESAEQFLNNAFALLDNELEKQPFLVGGSTGVADIYLAMLLTWYPDQQKLYDSYPNLRKALDQTLKLEGVEAVFRENESL